VRKWQRTLVGVLVLPLTFACDDAGTTRAKTDAREACEGLIEGYMRTLSEVAPAEAPADAPVDSSTEPAASTEPIPDRRSMTPEERVQLRGPRALTPRELRAGRWIDETRGDRFQFRWPNAEIVELSGRQQREPAPVVCAGELWDREVTLLSIGGQQQRLGRATNRY
jgi:hypothetical protein